MTVTDVELDEIAEARTTWAEWCQSTPTSPSRPKERPLLMSGPLVLATLADRKTQTRRLPRPGGYGQPGDFLWVRETWAMGWYQDDCRCDDVSPDYTPIWYRADGVRRGGLDGPGKWRPSIHMPRWASRLTLEILEVRTEPLQAITIDDARAEGLSWAEIRDVGNNEQSFASPRAMFADLWDKLNGTRAPWASNPEVTVITFKRVAS